MGKGRLETFSDGVLAIIITIMVLEMKTPHAAELSALRPLASVFLSYALSFLYLGIYWSNHHHLLYVTHRVSGTIMWANLHLLFWLSLVPFVTGWLGESHFAPGPTMLYGGLLLVAGIAYWLLQYAILRQEGAGSTLAAAVGRDWKARVSLVLFAVAIPLALLRPWIAGALYAFGVLPWFVPDRRIERRARAEAPETPHYHRTMDSAGHS
jgi:uncharacterized membrane protein